MKKNFCFCLMLALLTLVAVGCSFNDDNLVSKLSFSKTAGDLENSITSGVTNKTYYINFECKEGVDLYLDYYANDELVHQQYYGYISYAGVYYTTFNTNVAANFKIVATAKKGKNSVKKSIAYVITN